MKVDELQSTLKMLSTVFASSGELISDCFSFFGENAVSAFNGRIGFIASLPSGIKISGNLPGKSTLDALSVFCGQDVTITDEDTQLVFATDAKEVCVIKSNLPAGMLAEMSIPADGWKKLPVGFVDAVYRASLVTYKSPEKPILHYVHCKGNVVEATDNKQLYRELIDGEVDNMLLFGQSIKTIKNLNLTEYAIDSGWIFFRSEEKVTVVLRTLESEFVDIARFLISEGDTTFVFPDCGEFVDKLIPLLNAEDAPMRVVADGNKLTLLGQTTKIKVRSKFDWKSDTDFEFSIYPELFKKVNQMQVKLTTGMRNIIQAVSADKRMFYTTTLIVQK